MRREQRGRPRAHTHADLDSRALALAKEIAGRLEHDPGLVGRAAACDLTEKTEMIVVGS